jgi:ribosomal protein S18 acetylase RimI-like enzyme
VIVRPVNSDDFPKLKIFACSNGAPHQDEVERWIRRKAPGWVRSSPAHNELRVLVTDDDEIVGVCAFEPGADEEEWFILALAIHRDFQKQGHASTLLDTCLTKLAERTPNGRAYWKVHRDNGASHALSLGVGAVPDPAAPSAKLVTYYVAF